MTKAPNRLSRQIDLDEFTRAMISDVKSYQAWLNYIAIAASDKSDLHMKLSMGEWIGKYLEWVGWIEVPPKTDPEIRATFYAAAIRVAEQMGDRVKTMSWFGRNHRRRKEGDVR